MLLVAAKIFLSPAVIGSLMILVIGAVVSAYVSPAVGLMPWGDIIVAAKAVFFCTFTGRCSYGCSFYLLLSGRYGLGCNFCLPDTGNGAHATQ